MIGYHGTSHYIRKIRIAPKLSSNISKDNEGVGCYFFTDSKEKAAAYGRYVYTLEIDDPVPDFRKAETAMGYLEDMCQCVKSRMDLDISRFISFSLIADYITDGRIAVRDIGKEVWLHLDSSEPFYKAAGVKKAEKIQQLIKQYENQHLPNAWLFSASITNAGIVRKESAVRIIRMERSADIRMKEEDI